MAKKARSAKADRPRELRERRFEPRPTVDAAVVYLLGALGALALGAGAWGQLGPALSDTAPAPLKAAPLLLVGGALVVGLAVWLGTSGQRALRVGDGGIGVDKKPLVRMPWYRVERIQWRSESVRVTGKSETGEPMTIVVPAREHGQAAAWIVTEARERVPSVVDVPTDAALPAPSKDAGRSLPLDPPQVVGLHCAASGQVIAYEPDARACSRCGRVYHKAKMPETCACGGPPDGQHARAEAAPSKEPPPA